eukprot:c38257_g1_i1 orf=63-239(+)
MPLCALHFIVLVGHTPRSKATESHTIETQKLALLSISNNASTPCRWQFANKESKHLNR